MGVRMTTVTYSQLNDLLCNAMFSGEKSFLPAYVEIDDEVEISLIDFFESTIPNECLPGALN